MAEEKRFDEYPAEIFVGANEKNKARILGCCVCQSFPMYQATTTGCGIPLHCLCKKCVDELHISGHSKCPYCDNAIDKNKVESNNEKQQEIYLINVQCDQSGCIWSGFLVQWEQHMKLKHPLNNEQQAAPQAAPQEPGNCQVKVKDINNNTIIIRCGPNTTVKEFKQLFENEQGMPVYKQKFSWHGKVMEDNKTLNSLGIKNGSTIHSLKRFKG
eukprot:302390_1